MRGDWALSVFSVWNRKTLPVDQCFALPIAFCNRFAFENAFASTCPLDAQAGCFLLPQLYFKGSYHSKRAECALLWKDVYLGSNYIPGVIHFQQRKQTLDAGSGPGDLRIHTLLLGVWTVEVPSNLILDLKSDKMTR